MTGPAEVLILASAVIVLPLARALRARPWVVALLTLPPWALGLLAFGFRLRTVGEGLAEHGVRFAVGWDAHRIAEALTPVSATSVVVGLAWAVAAGGWRPTPPRPLDWAAAGLLGVGAALAGGTGWWALPAGLWAILPRRPEPSPAAAAATVVFAGSAATGAVAGLAVAASLYDPAAALGAAAAGTVLGAAGALLLAASARPISALVGLHAVPLLAAGVAAAALLRAAPPAALARRDLPPVDGEVPYRVPLGCLVEPDGAVVALTDAREAPECPAAPDGFPSGRRRWPPLFALPSDAPIGALWPASGGEAALLLQQPGSAGSAWGVVRLDVSVAAPGDRGIRQTVVSPRGEADLPKDARVDAVIPADAAPDVDAFLRICRRLRRAHGPALRCVVGAGDPARWR